MPQGSQWICIHPPHVGRSGSHVWLLRLGIRCFSISTHRRQRLIVSRVDGYESKDASVLSKCIHYVFTPKQLRHTHNRQEMEATKTRPQHVSAKLDFKSELMMFFFFLVHSPLRKLHVAPKILQLSAAACIVY